MAAVIEMPYRFLAISAAETGGKGVKSIKLVWNDVH